MTDNNTSGNSNLYSFISDESARQRMVQRHSSRSGVFVEKAHVSITKNAAAALVLSQIMYWFSYNERGALRARVHKHDEIWEVNSYKEWADQTGLSESQARKAIKLLVEMKLIITALHRFGKRRTDGLNAGGSEWDAPATLHVRPNWTVYNEMISEWERTRAASHPVEEVDTEMYSPSSFDHRDQTRDEHRSQTLNLDSHTHTQQEEKETDRRRTRDDSPSLVLANAYEQKGPGHVGELIGSLGNNENSIGTESYKDSPQPPSLIREFNEFLAHVKLPPLADWEVSDLFRPHDDMSPDQREMWIEQGIEPPSETVEAHSPVWLYANDTKFRNYARKQMHFATSRARNLPPIREDNHDRSGLFVSIIRHVWHSPYGFYYKRAEAI